MRYRIKTPTIAVRIDHGERIATKIPKGDIVEVAGPPIQDNRLIRVQWDGETVEMFSQDLLERGERVNASASSR